MGSWQMTVVGGWVVATDLLWVSRYTGSGAFGEQGSGSDWGSSWRRELYFHCTSHTSASCRGRASHYCRWVASGMPMIHYQ